jgi:hypothetical protein
MGPSLTGVTGELADSLDGAGGGIDGGLAIRSRRSPRAFGFQGELLFTSRSRSFYDVVGFRRSLQVVYAQVPVLARVTFRGTGKFRPYALAGPYFAWRLASTIVPGHYVGDEPINPHDVRAHDAGAILGLGSDVVAGTGRAAFELRVGLGFDDVLQSHTKVGGAYRVVTLLLAFTPGKEPGP